MATTTATRTLPSTTPTTTKITSPTTTITPTSSVITSSTYQVTAGTAPANPTATAATTNIIAITSTATTPKQHTGDFTSATHRSTRQTEQSAEATTSKVLEIPGASGRQYESDGAPLASTYRTGTAPTFIVGTTNPISVAISSVTSSFSFTMAAFRPANEISQGNIQTTSVGDDKVNSQVPVGSLLEIKTSNGGNVTVEYGITVALQEELNVIRLINDKNEGRFRLESATYRCVFLNESSGEWSSYGMTNLGVDDKGKVRCKSNHTTIFAVLLSVTGRLVPASAKPLSYVCGSLSVISLVATLIVLTKVRKRLRNERTVVQINLTIALLLFHFFNLIHDAALKSQRACEFIALALHYTILSSAFWMLVEGVTLMLKTSDRALNASPSGRIKAIKFLFAWGLPGLLLVCSAIPGFLLDKYMASTGQQSYTKCWMKASVILYTTVIAPVAITIFINLLILIRVGVFIYSMSKQTESFKPIAERMQGEGDVEHLKAAFRATVMLLPILSVPWILFFLVDTSDAFLYLTIVVNGLQGFFVLLVYCVFSKEVRNASVSLWNRTRVGKRLTIARKKKRVQVDSSTTNGNRDTTAQSTGETKLE